MLPILGRPRPAVNGSAGVRREPVAVLALVLALGGCVGEPDSLTVDWDDMPDRRWVGPDLWANRLQDWRVQGRRLESTTAMPMRTAHVLTARVPGTSGGLQVAVRLGLLDAPDKLDREAAAGAGGILFGAGPDLDYRSAALIHHSWGRGAGFFAGVSAAGQLFVRDLESEDGWLARPDETDGRVSLVGEVALRLTVSPGLGPDAVTLELRATDAAGSTARLRVEDLPAARVAGNLAVVSDVPRGEPPFWFDDLVASGERLRLHPDRALGPVVGIQHTLNRGTLKLAAQFFPLGPAEGGEALLEILENGAWRGVSAAQIVEPGFTATFTVRDWDDTRDHPVRVLHAGKEFEGLVPRDPRDQDAITVAAFTGNHNVAKPVPGRWSGVDGGWFPWDWGVWFPHEDLVGHVNSHDPDLLFFSGDQVYEGASPTSPDRERPYLDYLYRWYLWHWAFSDLTRRLPSVTIPDDHDVYHGNVWGAGGVATPPGLTGTAAQDAGGYRMPAEFVRMVERTQTSHLPDSSYPNAVKGDIGVYFTQFLYGGISFAVLEDRKFKSAPASLLPDARIVNGWAQAPGFDPLAESDVPGATLLGDEQIAFLESWADSWADGTWMKVALSQTLFVNLATLPAEETSDANVPVLRIVDPGEYPPGDRVMADMDSNGWPRSGRDRALRALRRGFAVHIAGDQHLGSTVQYGVDDWEDAAYALCVPSIANFFPRRWFPPEPGQNRPSPAPAYTGRFLDGFGNRMTVHAVSNPVRTGIEPAALHDLAPGYGLARFNRSDRRVSLEAWPRWSDPAAGGQPYPGWPVTFDQMDGFGGQIFGWLPELRIHGMDEPVVRIVAEGTGETLFTLRSPRPSFIPPVYAAGSYTAIVGEPGTESWTEVHGLVPGTRGEVSPIDVRFTQPDP